MDGYVPKPINREQLLETIAAVAGEGALAQSAAGSAQAPSAAGTIDPAVLENLKMLEAGGYFSLEEFLQVFSEDSHQRLAALRRAVEEGDARSLEREAHTLKGSSREVGASRLAALCQELEDLGESGTVAGAREKLAPLEAELARVQAALGEHLQQQE